MRAITLAILVLGCHHDESPPHEAVKPRVEAAAAPKAVDAAIPDGAVVDAAIAQGAQAVPDVPAVPAVKDAKADASDYPFYDREAIGPLHTKMTDKELIAVLGAPQKKEKPSEEGATGQWVGTWTWMGGASALMVADKKKGPWSARDVSVTAPSTYATKLGIHVGSSRADLQRLYARSDEDQDKDPNSYVVGSVYGGMLFMLKKDIVTSISIGVFAF